MQQVQDFLEESEILYDVLQTLDSRGFDRKTQFKNWTIDDVLVHLHFWNLGADLALNNPDAFKVMFDALFDALKSGKLREYENEKISQRGAELLDIWITQTYSDFERAKILSLPKKYAQH